MHPALTKKKQKKSYFFHRDVQGKLWEGAPDKYDEAALRKALLKRARRRRRNLAVSLSLIPQRNRKTEKKKRNAPAR